MTKKIAYLILLVSLVASGYFVYDTYMVVSGKKDDSDNEESRDKDSSSVTAKYNEYDIDEKFKYSLAQVKDTKTTLYFYNKEVNCSTVGVFKSTYADLGLVLTVGKEKDGTDSVKISTSSLYSRKTNGKYIEITGIPKITNSIQLTKSTEKITGETNLVWDNRTVKGKFEATICAAL